MNVLPLVCAFILIFSLGAYTLLHRLFAVTEEEHDLGGAMRIHQLHVNRTQGKVYEGLDGESIEKKSSDKKEKKLKENIAYLSPRDKNPPSENAKLSLALLSTKTPSSESKLVHKTASALIKRLYEHTSVYRPGLEDEILKTIISLQHKHPQCPDLETLMTFIEEDRDLFYKLFRGTNEYQLFTSKGYPALGDFFTLDKERPKPIYLLRATKALLLVLFDDPIANQITLIEQEKWKKNHTHEKITKDELNKLYLDMAPRGKLFSEIESICEFNKPKKAKKSAHQPLTDTHTKMTVRN